VNNQPTIEPPVRDISRPRRKFPWRFVDLALSLLVVAILVSQIVIWNAWESGWGDSLKNLITVSQGILFCVWLTCWWFAFGPARFTTRLMAGIPVLLVLGGWIACIRRIEPTGDMLPHIVYKWQALPEEELARHLSKIERPSGDQLAGREVPAVAPEDMPGYRGTHRDGVVVGPELASDWSTSPPRELFRQPCGGGYSAFAVVGPLLITMEQRRDDEVVVCYDSVSGKEQWAVAYPASFAEAMGGAGPRSRPTIVGDAVFTFGAFGDLHCLDLLTGTTRWHVNVLQQFGLPNTDWAMTSSPLPVQGNIIVNVGGLQGNGLAAYSQSTGELAWKTAGLPEPVKVAKFDTGAGAAAAKGKSIPGYSSPMIATVAGVEQILNFDGKGLHGNDPVDGRELWFFPFSNDAHVNVAQPIVLPGGDSSSRIFISASYNTGSVMLKVDRGESGEWSVGELWRNLNMKCKFTSPVYFDGYLYGLDEGIMVCLDPQTGERKWKGGRTGLRGRYQHGQILLVNDKIVVLSEQGELVLIEPTATGLQELSWFQALPPGKNWNPLTVAHGRAYVRNTSEMAAFDLTPR